MTSTRSHLHYGWKSREWSLKTIMRIEERGTPLLYNVGFKSLPNQLRKYAERLDVGVPTLRNAKKGL